MEKLYLEIPSIERKNEIINYLDEFVEYKSDLNGTGGLDKVMLDCDVSNIGSDKTMQALGGVLTRTEIDPSDGILTNVYWFDVIGCIEKYELIYQPMIETTNLSR